jgi:hypothetical protein
MKLTLKKVMLRDLTDAELQDANGATGSPVSWISRVVSEMIISESATARATGSRSSSRGHTTKADLTRTRCRAREA